MTLSKTVKKKNTKVEKNKKQHDKYEDETSSTQTTKNGGAANTVREMLMEAERIRKDHMNSLKSQKGRLKPTVSNSTKITENATKTDNNKKNDGRRKPATGSISFATEREKIGKDLKNSLRKGVSFIAKKESLQDATNINSKKLLQELGLPESANKKEECPKAGSQHRSLTMKVEINKKSAYKNIRSELENMMKIDDYQVGGQPFVSLELLDQTTCSESNTLVSARKNTAERRNRSREVLPKTSENSSGNNLKKTKSKKKVESQTKTTTDHKSSLEEKNKIVNPPLENCQDLNAVLQCNLKDFNKANEKYKQKWSLMGNTNNHLSNVDSNISTVIGAGDLFSSNTSHSYYSSESDISKIDRKFMHILEAVAQTKLEFNDPRCKHHFLQKHDTKEKDQVNSDKKFKGVAASRSIEENIAKRINSLEKRLGFSKASEEKPTENKEENVIKNCQNGDVQELWLAEISNRNKPLEAISDKKEKDNDEPKSNAENKLNDTRKSSGDAKSSQDLKESEEVINSNDRNTRKPDNTVPNTLQGKSSNPEPVPKAKKLGAKIQNKDIEGKRIIRQKSTKIIDQKKMDEEAGQRIKTWSILKRLEKAFETLGLHMDDLENSDEAASSAKKKPRTRKYGSSGKERKEAVREESVKKTPEPEQVGVIKKKRKRTTQTDVDCAVDGNGSGDKNIDLSKLLRFSKQCDPVKSTKLRKSDAYYASVMKSPRERVATSDLNVDTGFQEMSELTKKLYGEKTKTKKSKTLVDQYVNEAGNYRHWQEDYKTKRTASCKSFCYDLDENCRKKHVVSDKILSVSGSLTSVTEENDIKTRNTKRKKSKTRHVSRSLKFMCARTSGKGDADHNEPITEDDLDYPVINPGNSHEIFQIEKENNEFELRQIRARRKQIVSEIKTSLNEIKRQHGMFAKLQRQTKKFHRDCSTKKRLLASYLDDVETCYQKRRAMDRYPRSLSSDRCEHKIRNKPVIKIKSSEYDMGAKFRRKICRKWYRPEAKSMTYLETGSTFTDETSTVELSRTSSEITSESDKKVLLPIRSNDDGMEFEMRKNMETGTSQERMNYVPSYLAQLLEKLNRIILTEKSNLENLVVRASGSSNSACSDKTRSTASTNSGQKQGKQQKKSAEDAGKSTTTSNKYVTSNISTNGLVRHNKSRQQFHKKETRCNKTAEVDGCSGKVGKAVQCDPGGIKSYDSVDSEQEVLLTEACLNNLTSDTSLTRLERQAEECKYRKGDPSFRSKSHLLKYFAEHGKHPKKKSPEEEEAQRRKRELERILRMNEKNLRRNHKFGAGIECHSLDHDGYQSKSKTTSLLRHRQQSIIIDHNRGEENDESKIVLGHASRHSGVGFGSRTRKSAQEYYLKAERSAGTDFHGKTRSDIVWRKSGKKHRSDEVPVNYCDVSVNMPGCSRGRSRDADCQTDLIEEDDFSDICLMDEAGSTHS